MGRGGMRWGAGRPGWKVKAEHCRQIDVRRWQREGMLEPGRAGGWRWWDADTGTETASIGWRSEVGAVVLDYAMNGTPVQQRVLIERTTCSYGGARVWFNCPRCSRRVALLYLRGSCFACRHCQHVVYSSQSEDALSRSWRRQQKAEARLGPGWGRPKGMHHATRERLIAVVFKCEEQREDALAAFIKRMGGPELLGLKV